MTDEITQRSPPEAKVELFAGLFRGREDVYPRRFESLKRSKSGYAPACGNEWIRGICEKPRIRCADCPNRKFLTVTHEVIRWHLSGQDSTGKPFVMGVYPLLRDETCHFLAIDLDRENWKDDVAALMATCGALSIPAALERSRSGNGGHIWIFFSQAVPAVLARKLGAHLLTETLERHPGLGLRSYDRLFPNQDTLPKGGFGNLIALPLQRAPRVQGNSVFIDTAFQPHPDQWQYLASLQRLTASDLESRVGEAEKRGRIIRVKFAEPPDGSPEPWASPPSRRTPGAPIAGQLPQNLTLVLGDQIYIPTIELPPSLRNRLIHLAAFQNPEFYRAQAMRLSTHALPRIISCAEDLPQHIGLPRGCRDEVQELLTKLGIAVSFRDERQPGTPFMATFVGELRPGQKDAAEALLKHDTGVLAATTAFGKTVVAAWMIARRAVNTLVLVHREQLMEQWVERLNSFLTLPEKSVGRLGGGRRKLTGILDVALVQSLVRKGVVDDRVAQYGQLIVDECHHVAAHSFEQIARRTQARYVLGLSATVKRKDGHDPIIFMQCGPIRHRVDARQEAAIRPFRHEVIVRPTGFRSGRAPADDARVEFQELCAELAHCPIRNRKICDDVAEVVRSGRWPLVLTERTEHLQRLADGLRERALSVIILQGGLGRLELKSALSAVDRKDSPNPRVIVATGKFVGEGFDDARLDSLFLAMPVSWQGTIAQYAGRLHRLHADKREVRIYDYADLDVPMLRRMFDRRCSGYEAVGYTVLLPASAVSGWPVDVPLPVHPEWKQSFSASVQRLIRDGVDAPLAALFLRANPAGPMDPVQARSASEAFLHRRLETLPGMSGRFQLNVQLPIPFDGFGRMEVDFLDHAHRLVIELDGDQHLADVEAYRRDRRKDALLQEHGYHVLRFLAQDLGRRLDEILDAILRALTYRTRPGIPA